MCTLHTISFIVAFVMCLYIVFNISVTRIGEEYFHAKEYNKALL